MRYLWLIFLVVGQALAGSSSLTSNSAASSGTTTGSVIGQMGPLAGINVETRIGVPSYFAPSSPVTGNTTWTQVTQGAGTVGFCIINPASGPGPSQDANYVNQTLENQRRGVATLGYVSTTFGITRTQAAIQADIDAYYTFYNVDGIFLDECATGTGFLPLYRNLYTYIKNKPGSHLVVLNPGTEPNETYLTAGDIICVFEGDHTAYQSYTPNAYIAKYSPTRFWHIIYNTTGTQMEADIRLSRANGAGWVFITDDVLSNPFDRMPPAGYWQNELMLAENSAVQLQVNGTRTQMLGTLNVSSSNFGTTSNSSATATTTINLAVPRASGVFSGAVDGDIGYDTARGTGYSKTPLVSEQFNIGLLVAPQQSDDTTQGTATYTDIGVQFSSPALKLTTGKTIRIKWYGLAGTNVAGTDFNSVQLLYGATKLWDAVTGPLAGATQTYWIGELTCTVRSTGATGTIHTQGFLNNQYSGIQIVQTRTATAQPVTVDTTATTTWKLQSKGNTTNANNFTTISNMTWEVLY